MTSVVAKHDAELDAGLRGGGDEIVNTLVGMAKLALQGSTGSGTAGELLDAIVPRFGAPPSSGDAKADELFKENYDSGGHFVTAVGIGGAIGFGGILGTIGEVGGAAGEAGGGGIAGAFGGGGGGGGAGMTLFHGTDAVAARNLLKGTPLDAATAAAGKIDGPAGFFLATDADAATFFALRRSPGAVLQYEFSGTAASQLSAQGAILRPIPAGGMRGGFPGQEFFVPRSSFDLFNTLRRAGHIKVGPL